MFYTINTWLIHHVIVYIISWDLNYYVNIYKYFYNFNNYYANIYKYLYNFNDT